MIYNFGQTPSHLLRTPHVRRFSAQEIQSKKSKSSKIFLNPSSTASNQGLSGPTTSLVSAKESETSSSNDSGTGHSVPGTSPTKSGSMPPNHVPYSYNITTPANTPFVVMLNVPNATTQVLMIGCDGVVANASITPSPDGHGLPFTLDLDKNIANPKHRRISQQVGEWVSAISNVYSLCGDGKVIVSSSEADQAILYSAVATCKTVRRVVGHLGPITCLAVAEDGMLVTGSVDHTVLVWDTTPVSRTIAGSSWNRAPRDEDASPDFPIHTLTGHDDAVQCVVLSSDLDIVVSGSRDGTCIIHTLHSPKYVRSLYMGSPIDLLRLSKEGDIISYSGSTNTLWAHTLNGTLLGTVNIGQIDAMVTDQQGRFIVTGSHTGGEAAVVIRSLKTGLSVAHQFDSDVGIRSLAFVCDDKYLMAGLEDGHLSIYDFSPLLWPR